MSVPCIDLNADLGESAAAIANGADFELLRYITSANIACGGHAGVRDTMLQTLAACKQLNVAAGAHPGYVDRENFGRVELALPPPAIESSVREQIEALNRLAASLEIHIGHVKPHGALYHAANNNCEVALAIGRAALSIDPGLVMVGQAGFSALNVWKSQGLTCAGEAFADRAYEPDGSLRPRSRAGALLQAPAAAAEQALKIATLNKVALPDGSSLKLTAETLCIHSDTPGAAAIARAVREALQTSGIRVRPLLATN